MNFDQRVTTFDGLFREFKRYEIHLHGAIRKADELMRRIEEGKDAEYDRTNLEFQKNRIETKKHNMAVLEEAMKLIYECRYNELKEVGEI